MNYHNYEQASDRDVINWLEESLNLTSAQKQKLYNETYRYSPFRFFKKRKRVKNLVVRFSVVLIPIVFLVIFISLPFNYLVTGRWGYSYDKIKWYDSWINSVGF